MTAASSKARGTGRGYRSAHCEACGLREVLCLCSELPRFELTTRVWFVMHWRETSKPSSTARLAKRVLPNSHSIERGRDPSTRLAVEQALAPLDPRSCLLLYPSDDAGLLDEASPQGLSQPIQLLVPDGTWAQTRRWIRREPALAQVPRVRLPDDVAACTHRLRRAADAHLYSTFEATALALGVIHGQELSERMLGVFERWQTLALASRAGGLSV